ncbi:arsenate reductase/protein-tyrosine-phosphatase family protein [Vibrio algarum]|uniref:protein-tyrosine-phosphatase n=1 Tax=Vibrio algarum TaxID=3020714 RepID=A0ABT4YQM7_9VIBR|nr:ATP-grasp domain-containing protein [Vibrio sp. KJ40-1]MDB1123707.1 ATP-grasp domain-containing protein [Vibrio sp. KJ40-1]
MTNKSRKKTPSVLVLGEDTRSFLSVIRSLGKAGYDVHVVCYDRTSPALKSKYVSSAQFYNYQAYSQSEWLENVIALIERYQFHLVIPCDERAIYPLWSAKHRIPANTQLAIANQLALDVLFDKWKTKQIAIECNVSVADGNIVNLSDTTYEQLVGVYGKKFVIKPLQSFEESKLSQRQKVAIVKSESDFNSYIRMAGNGQQYLVEKFFSGKGEGLSVLSIKGKVYAAFAHIRVAEPNHGGGSSYRKSIPLDPELLEATKSICLRSELTGVAMFEYRRDLQTNEWILVEVNARFWGSLPLAEYAGVDFPALYADYLVSGELPSKIQLEYRQDVFARVLTADLYEIKREYEIAALEKGKWNSLMSLLDRLVHILRFLGPKETIDSFDVTDPRPFIRECILLFGQLFKAFVRKNSFLLRFRRNRTRARLKKLFKLNSNRTVLFVCYGNIMRSPFALKCFQDAVDNSHGHIVLSGDSFGFHLDENRSSPEKACEAALSLGYDLSTHFSKWMTQGDISESDIIVYFDEKNSDKLSAYYRSNYAFCAADLVDESIAIEATIEDPYGEELYSVILCYKEIESSVKALVGVYEGAIK